MLSYMGKGEENLRCSCCCPTIAAVAAHHCLSCVHACEEVQDSLCSTDISHAEGCVGILLLLPLDLETIPLTYKKLNPVIKIQCLIQSEVPDGMSDTHMGLTYERDITNKSCKFSWSSWNSYGIFYDTYLNVTLRVDAY